MSLYTKDQKFYLKIWEEREHESEVSQQPLGDIMSRWFMSHIIGKQAFPKFRHNPENILLMTPDEHTLWENHKSKIKDIPMWGKVFELEERLKMSYYDKTNVIRV